MGFRSCTIVAALVAFAQCVALAADDGALDAQQLRGRAIYREGRLSSGEPLVGAGLGGVARSGRDAACLSCHRRSGFGISEGTFIVRPITGPDLFGAPRADPAPARLAHWLAPPVRRHYDDALLARAVREGLDASGRPLQDIMPRYALGDADMAALTAYLKTLFAQPAPGVTATEIHLATVIQPDVPAARRRALLDVMDAFVREKNAAVRSEEVRRAAGTMRMFRAYRKWVVHVWELSGPPQDWDAQLEASYRAQPVFALVGGLGATSWAPVHAFSERRELPCVLPQTDLPAEGDEGFYTLYFSRGLALEAQVVAQFTKARRDARIVQVFRAGTPGADAATAFRRAFAGAPGTLEDRVLEGAAGPAFWSRLAAANASAVLLWLGAEDLPDPGQLAQGQQAPALYASASLLGGDGAQPKLPLLAAYPWELPSRRAAGVQRSTLWLRARGIEPREEDARAAAVHTLFALTVAGDSLMHLQDSFSRDYFMERVEHTVNTTIAPTYYPRTTLGQGARFASKGAYIVRWNADAGRSPGAVSEWIVP